MDVPILLILVLHAVEATNSAPITALAITSDGQHLLTGSQAGVQIPSLDSLGPTDSLPGDISTSIEHVHDLAFSPTGKLLAIAGGSPGEKGVVELWNWPERKLMRSLPAGNDVVYRVAWNADGTAIAIAGGDKQVRILPLDDQHQPLIIECHSAAVLSVAWLTEPEIVLSAGVDQSIRVIDPASGKVLRSLDNHTAAVRDLAVRPGMHAGPALVASAGADRTIRFWQPAIGRMVRFVRLPAAATALAWTSDGGRVLAACEDGVVRGIEPESLAVAAFQTKPRNREADASRSPEESRPPGGWLHSITVLPGGKAAVAGGEHGRLHVVPLDAINR
jgi:WD40 repeat protein